MKQQPIGGVTRWVVRAGSATQAWALLPNPADRSLSPSCSALPYVRAVLYSALLCARQARHVKKGEPNCCWGPVTNCRCPFPTKK